MGIVQENRFDAPQPDVNETEYGATYVTAARETPVAPAVVAAEEKVEEEVSPAESPAAVEKKKGGRPKKSDKKK